MDNEEKEKIIKQQKGKVVSFRNMGLVKEDYEKDQAEQYNGDKLLSKEEWLKQKRGEILWGQSFNLAYTIGMSKGLNLQDIEDIREDIFLWLWETKDDYKNLIQEHDKTNNK